MRKVLIAATLALSIFFAAHIVPVYAADTVLFLTSGTSWTVPSDWNSASNTIELIGGGGAGYNALSNINGAGGGGGAYVESSNITLTPGGSITIQIGQGGLASATSSGTDTIFNSTSTTCASVSSPALCAQGGKVSDGSSAGGVGGSASVSVGTVKYAGGGGGSNCDVTGCDGNGGGGGAGGPNGAGAAGGTGDGNNWEAVGGGGGGASGGSAGAAGAANGGNGVGGAGGNNSSGTGGGSGGAALGAAGAAGTDGGGGGGGGNPDFQTDDAGPGGAGGNGIEWDATHGAGGGGGAAGNDNRISSFTSGVGGSGGLYGGGGGAGNPGGNGAQGIIVITYTPLVLPTTTTQAATSLGQTSATGNGNITATGGATVTTRGFVYGATTSYGATTTDSGSYGSGAFTGSISGLTCATTYHYTAYATNSIGMSYGTDTTFTTSACPQQKAPVPAGNGMIFTGTAASLPNYVAPRPQIVYPDGHVEYLDASSGTQISHTASDALLSSLMARLIVLLTQELALLQA